MSLRNLHIAAVAGLLLAGGALAQTPQTQTAPGTKAPPSTTTPSTTTTPRPPYSSGTTGTAATTGATTAAGKPGAASKVNLNTATEAQLDALPNVGKARASAIVKERNKGGPFKDWSDFDSRTAHSSVNAGVKAKIKDMVTF
jgi:DNA uptake protein ComE-like DNA-binding protein